MLMQASVNPSGAVAAAVQTSHETRDLQESLRRDQYNNDDATMRKVLAARQNDGWRRPEWSAYMQQTAREFKVARRSCQL